jgi:hypothetical protein
MLQVTQVTDGVAIVDAAGTLTTEDYRSFENELEEAMEGAAPRCMLVRLKDFHGWAPGAIWKDVEFGLEHRRTFERIAVVGHSSMVEWMTRLTKPFYPTDLRYFDEDQAQGAIAWLREAEPGTPG